MYLYFTILSILVIYGALGYNYPIASLVILGTLLILSIPIVLLILKLPKD